MNVRRLLFGGAAPVYFMLIPFFKWWCLGSSRKYDLTTLGICSSPLWKAVIGCDSSKVTSSTALRLRSAPWYSVCELRICRPTWGQMSGSARWLLGPREGFHEEVGNENRPRMSWWWTDEVGIRRSRGVGERRSGWQETATGRFLWLFLKVSGVLVQCVGDGTSVVLWPEL